MTNTYMIDGLETSQKVAAPWELALTTKSGRVTRWPAGSREEALRHQRRVALRPDFMVRIEVRAQDYAAVLWDVEWPRATPLDMLAMPPELAPHLRVLSGRGGLS